MPPRRSRKNLDTSSSRWTAAAKWPGAYRRLEVLRQAKELDAAPPELPTGPFQVIVADPPWRYESGNSLP